MVETFSKSNGLNIEVDYNCVRERVALKQLEIRFISSGDQIIDEYIMSFLTQQRVRHDVNLDNIEGES